MMGNVDMIVTNCGGEATIAAMDEYSRAEIGRKTYRFVRRCMRDPVLRAKIKARAEEIRAAENQRKGETYG